MGCQHLDARGSRVIVRAQAEHEGITHRGDTGPVCLRQVHLDDEATGGRVAHLNDLIGQCQSIEHHSGGDGGRRE